MRAENTSRVRVPVCALGAKARWETACSGNRPGDGAGGLVWGREWGGEREEKEKMNTSLNFPLPSSYTLEIEIIITT